MRVQWFGESWGAPVCDAEYHAETPVGVACLHCQRPIQAGDQGLIMDCVTMDVSPDAKREPAHLDCFLKDLGIVKSKGGSS